MFAFAKRLKKIKGLIKLSNAIRFISLVIKDEFSSKKPAGFEKNKEIWIFKRVFCECYVLKVVVWKHQCTCVLVEGLADMASKVIRISASV